MTRMGRGALGNFPQTKTVALRYVQTFALNGGAGATAVQVFRGNSVNDPDYTGAGHQPMFSDNYAAIYGSYRVNYATIKLMALSTHIVNVATVYDINGTTTSNPQYYAANERACRIFILRDDAPGDYTTSLDTLIEEGSRNFRWKYCPQTTSGTIPSVKMSVTPHKLLNLAKNDDTLKAVVGVNPASPVYFVCGVEGLGGSNPDSMEFQAIITYNVTYSNLIKNQTQN